MQGVDDIGKDLVVGAAKESTFNQDVEGKR